MHLHADHNNKLIDFRDENDNCDENCEVDDEVMAKEDLLLRSVICTPSLLFAPHLLLRSVICTPSLLFAPHLLLRGVICTGIVRLPMVPVKVYCLEMININRLW